jgi:hypothetical protein
VKTRPWLKRLLVCACLLLVVALPLVGITSYLRLSRDARCLRDSVVQSFKGQAVSASKKIELSAGALTFYALRAGLSFAPLPPEAQSALRAARGAEVGVYELGRGSDARDYAAILTRADVAMAARGWERMVGLAREREMLAVYVPEGQSSPSNVRACIAVVQGKELVIVSARSNLDPLLELASAHAGWHEHRARGSSGKAAKFDFTRVGGQWLGGR